MKAHSFYYLIKPLLPRKLQIFVRRQRALYKKRKYADVWPINPNCGKPDPGWQGWPDNKQFCLVLSHDVDTQKGHDNALNLLEIENQLGFRSSFNFVPERYKLSIELIREVQRRGFGVAVHGLKHDGKLFSSERIFDERSKKINAYLKSWGTRGFTTPAMIRNLDWMHKLDIEYATCTFDTDPIEPQPEGVCKIFPFWVKQSCSADGYVELPYTLPQDFTLYILLREKNIDTWKSKLNWIVSQKGMALLNTHPDYMNFGGNPNGLEEYSINIYKEFLKYVKNNFQDRCWNALPSEVSGFMRSSCDIQQQN